MSSAAKELFKRAEQAVKKGNYEYAIELYIQGLAVDPSAADERRTLHNVEAKLIQQNGGNPHGGVAVKFKTAGLLAKVKKLSVQKKWDEALLELERCLRHQPQNASLLIQGANFLEHMEHTEAAIGVLEEAVAFDKENVDAYRKLGQLCTQSGDVEKAISHWEKLRMYRPQDKEAAKAIRDLSAANLVRRAEERKEESGDESFRAMLKDEEESEDLEKKAKVIRTDEDRVRAIGFKKEELRKEPRNSRLWRELGALYQDLKRWKYAQAAYKKALEVNPHDLFAHDKIGALEEQRKDDELRQLEEQVETARQNGVSAEELAKLESRLSAKRDEVTQFKMKEYERRVKAHPTDYDLKLRYAQQLINGAEYDRAIEQLQKAVKDPKLKVVAQNSMGLCFKEKGVYAVAVAQFTEALKSVSDPDSDVAKEIKYNLAVASQEQGDTDTALTYFQEIMAVDIGYRDVSQRVDALMRAGG